MKYHDSLGITEFATSEEIQAAYTQKQNMLIASRAYISEEVFTIKQQELDFAMNECISWSKLEEREKVKLRMRNCAPPNKRPRKIYSVCFGPCTFADICCGTACDGSSANPPTCCEQSIGSQTCPIVCDAIILSPIAFYIVVGIIHLLTLATKGTSKVIGDAKRSRSVAKGQNIRKKISELQSDMSDILHQRAILESQDRAESHTLENVAAFADLFSSMGIVSTATITSIQKTKVDNIRTQIQACLGKERVLQEEISINERKL